MTSDVYDIPICKLSYHGDWTPLNQIFFSQCIQDSDEERSFNCQQKKWKKTRYLQRKDKTYRNYTVYEFASSSESDISTSNELNLADNYERNIQSTNSNEPVINSSDEYDNPLSDRNVKRSISDKPNFNSSNEFDDLLSEERVMVDDDKSCSEPEVHISNELNSSGEQEGNIKRNIYNKPNINSSDVNDGLFYEGKVRIDGNKSYLEPEVQISDEMNSADEHKNNMHLKQSSLKYKKHAANKNESSDEWEMHSNASIDYSDSSDYSDNNKNNKSRKKSAVKYKKYTANKNKRYDKREMHSNASDDYYDSSDSSYNYKVPKKKRNQKPKSSQLSEYEKMVQKNKEEKLTFLKSLKIFEAKENFIEAVKTLKPERSKKEQYNKRKVFQNLDNCLTEEINEAKVYRRSTRQKNVLEKKEGMFASSQSSDKLLPDLTFEEALKRGEVYHDFISDVGGSKYKMPQLLNNDFKSHFEKMALRETQIISYSPISSIAIHESQENIIICAGNGNGEIIFWHVNSDYDVSTFQLHLKKVTCLKFNPYLPNAVISSGFDGTMYCGDFEKKMFSQIFKAKSCTYFDFFSPTSYLVAHGIRYVSIIDIRTYRKTFEKRHKCNEDAVKTVSLHPMNKNYFISAHEKGAIRLWDLRKLQNEPVIEVYCKAERLISSSFSPVTGNSVLVTTDNSLCLLDNSSRILNKEFTLKESIEHENYKFGFTPFQAVWLPNTDDTFVIGSKLKPRGIEIFDDKLCNIFNFTEKHFNYIPYINVFHSSLPFLASASRNKVSIFSDCE